MNIDLVCPGILSKVNPLADGQDIIITLDSTILAKNYYFEKSESSIDD